MRADDIAKTKRADREMIISHKVPPEKRNGPTIFIALWLVIATTCCSACVSQEISKDTTEKIERFLRNVVADTLEKDYRSHNIHINVLVTDLKIDSLSKKETGQDNVYFAQGRVSYIIKGRRKWKDQEGNIIQLDPEREITHWYTCGVLEDKYMHALFKDDRHRLAFYADKPTEEDLK